MWRKERLGLLMVLSSLVVIAIIIAMLFHAQRTSEEDQIRTHVSSLVKIMGKMTWEQLIANSKSTSILNVLHYSRGDSRYAYSSVIDVEGRIKNQLSVPGVVVPNSTFKPEPSVWLGEQVITTENSNHTFLEFLSPILNNGALKGYVKLGYRKPEFGLSYRQIPFVATLVLPIFLLVPIFYFLVRKEYRPIQQVSQKMEQLLEQSSINKMELQVSGEMGDFMDRMNRFIEVVSSKTEKLEYQRDDLFTSSKLLSYKHDKLESMLATIPDAILVQDLQGVTNYANEKITNVLGVMPEDIISINVKDWCTETKVIAYLSRFESQSYQGYTGGSLTFSPHNDKSKTLELRVYPLFIPNQESQLLGSMIVIRDISEEYAARTSRGEFVAQIGHELKTPLNVLAMYSDMLLGEDGEIEATRVEGLNIIHDQVERLSGLINNMLSITKLEANSIQLKRQRVRLNELLDDTFDAVKQTGQAKQIKFQIEMQRDVSAIYADKELLRIAVNNLLTNAIKYNKQGGQVILTLEETDNDFIISVQDNGIGISAQDQEHIFDKFYRSEDELVRTETGHGLGLSLVKQIVQLHHGLIKIDSSPGEGTEFSIRLEKDMNILQQSLAS